ncbi:MAG: OmpA family protein [Saprospiraceae bacterium]|nr:OmpA family protein [Candidatus Defluviibacterium haderslevense]
MRKVYILFTLSMWVLNLAQSQQTDGVITIINGSFEGAPKCCKPPEGWIDCGFKEETPTDIQPVLPPLEPLFGVTKKAYDGNTYLGMVVRQNETYERINQKLTKPLLAGKCYSFSIYMTRSLEYLSAITKGNPQLQAFTTPAILQIWGGEAYCHQKQLLDQSEIVENTEWKRFDFEFMPKSNITYLELEAYYKVPNPFPYNGNILLDNASHITIMPCPTEKAKYDAYLKKRDQQFEEKERKRLTQNTTSPNELKTPPKKQTVITATPTPNKSNKILKELDHNKVKVGQTIKIEKLFFAADSATINSSSFAVLDEVYDFLKSNPKITIEIGGHTNNIPTNNYCDKLSTNRAKAVRDYILSKGISEDRVTFKGYGKRMPISSNATKDGRALNQRVEIKIISV